MRNKNYSKFSQKFTKTENKDDINNKPIEGQVTINEVINSETTEANNYEVTMIGVVTGCNQLYVRKEANKESDPLCILEGNSEVKVDLNDSTSEDFYKVRTSTGVEGYCMKKYITIK